MAADSNPTLKSIFTKDGLRILIDILSRAPIADSSLAIKLRVDRVAQDVGTSEKTVQRVLRRLEAMSWLTRNPEDDGRNYRGRFSGREFLVGNELRQLLGLPINEKFPQVQQLSDGEIQKVSNSTGLSTKSVDNLPKTTQMSDGIEVNVLKEDLKEAFSEKTENQKTGLPDDLLPLQEALNLSKGGICALMALAKKYGKRLQDIWQAKKTTILKAGVTQGRAFYYFKALILAATHFKNDKNVSLGKKFFPDGNLLNDDRRFWHKRYRGANGVLVKIFDGTAEVSINRDYRFVPAAQMGAIYEAIDNGKLNELVE